MGTNRFRFNAKARKHTAGGGGRRKAKPAVADPAPQVDEKKVILDESIFGTTNDQDGTSTNQLISDPSADAAVETTPDTQPKMSSKKRKRLEKYIERKLKKEQRGILLGRLEKSSFSSDLLTSTKTLGQNNETLREKLKKTLQEERHHLPITHNDVSLIKEVDAPVVYEVQPIVVEASQKEPEAMPSKSESGTKKEVSPAPRDSALFNVEPVAEPFSPKKKRKRGGKKKTSAKISLSENTEQAADGVDSGANDTKAVLKEIDNATVTDIANGVSNDTVSKEIANSEIAPACPDTTKVEHDLKKAFYVKVNRSEEIQLTRLSLPVCAEEQSIMETIQENDVVIVCGETGSGKTTQIPQFLYEAGYGHPKSENPGRIGVTQPRRVAAVSMAKRVGTELGVGYDRVSYQIRFDSTACATTAINFMTDGVLLKHVSSQDFLLHQYSAIVVDEAHERSLNTDILIGLLSRIVHMRRDMYTNGECRAGTTIPVKPLKLIIMSATLRVTDFAENKTLFAVPPPIVKIDARQFPVTLHFNRRTQANYLEDAFRKVSKIHATLPAGGILVFLAGQNEITGLCRKLRKRYPRRTSHTEDDEEDTKADGAIQYAKKTKMTRLLEDSLKIDQDPTELMEQSEIPAADAIDDMDDERMLSDDESDFEIENDTNEPLHVLPLYALLPTHQQMKVFQPPPPGTRLCVVATNVAETSLTIPGIRYVVDAGKAKERCHDVKSKVQSFDVSWISKASAEQRAGRAGRVGPGHCYRLYSSAVFNDAFDQFDKPEIQRIPIDGVVLQMKAMGIDKVVQFPFPTPPDRTQLRMAEKLLVQLGALDEDKKCITDIGKAMAAFPLSPRYAKMIVLGHQKNLLQYIIAIVAALSVGDPFIREQDVNQDEFEDREDKRLRRGQFYKTHQLFAGATPDSDILKVLNAIGAASHNPDQLVAFCESHFLRFKAMKEIQQLRRQISGIIQHVYPEKFSTLQERMNPPTTGQRSLLRQLLMSGFVDQIARLDVESNKHTDNTTKFIYRTLSSDEPIFIHPSSCMFNEKPPSFVIYTDLLCTSKTYMKGITVIQSKWIANIAVSQCTFTKHLEQPVPRYDAKLDTIVGHHMPIFGEKNWTLPAIERPLGTGQDKVRYFLYYLLEGKIVPGFLKYKPMLESKPANILKPWTHAKIVDLVFPATRDKIDSKKSLLKKWKTDKQYLLRAYLAWLPSSLHKEVIAAWPLLR